ncbi:MAG: hypothetical protein N2652_11870 [Kiritimatiellae bacterium]|nr:hypothetical protein [Kiritimatiellia bacterium]
MRTDWRGPALAAVLLAAASEAGERPVADAARYRAPAVFRITTNLANAGVEAFTATIGPFGNALVTASFEPAVYRTRLFAAADAPDRVILDATAATAHDTLREGFYDGATVRVYRIVGGRLHIVRRDIVPEGGSAISGWLESGTSRDRLVAANAPEFVHRFDDWNRPGVPYYFTVTAIDVAGRESPCAAAADVVRERTGKRERTAEATSLVRVEFNSDRGSGVSPPAPRNLRAVYDPVTDSARLTWQPPPGDVPLAGYRVYRSDLPPQQHRGFFLQLAGGTPSDPHAYIRRGDWIVVEKTFTTFSRHRHLSNRIWGSHENRLAMPDGVPFYPDEEPGRTWVLEPHRPGAPVADGGATSLRIELQPGAKALFEQYNHAGTGQSWYPVLNPAYTYVVEFWARQHGMTTPRAVFSLKGHYARSVKPLVFELGGEWQRFRGTFRLPELWTGAGGVGQTSMAFEGPGTVWIDNYRVYADAAPFLDFLPYEYADLKASAISALRTHAFIKTRASTYDMEQFTNPAGVICGVERGNTLPQTLAAMEKAGVRPWLQVEMHMSPEEWLGFVEYIAAPYDPERDTPAEKPWAAKRFAQGRAAPWSDAFDRIYFEISNETWNWLFSPWVFEAMKDGATGHTYNRGEVYGLFQEHVIECLRASPWWERAGLDRKFVFVLGGWAGQNYGTQAAKHSPRSQYLTIAGYLGGWDEGEGPAGSNRAGLFQVLMQPGQSALPRAAQLRAERDALVAAGRPPLAIGTYEAGPGYALSGLNNQPPMSAAEVRAQEETMKSLAGGTATLDTFLARATEDFDLQNFFTFHHGGTHWVSHTAWHVGPLAHPCWMTLALFNREATGDLLQVETLRVPTIDLPKFQRRPAARDVPLAACYATRRGDRLCVFVLSRKVAGYPLESDDGFTPVALELPFTGARQVRLFRMAGDPAAHNLDREQVRIETIALPASIVRSPFVLDAATGADARGLPPAATFLYVFEGAH